MPNRILREAILDSEAVNKLTPHAEVFYRRLMSVVDDFGRFDARPAVLKSRLYPLRVDEVREADISRWTAECEKAGLIALYTVTGKRYLLFHKLGEPRAKTSKFPAPPDRSVKAVSDVHNSQGHARTCAQTRADVPLSSSYSPSPTPTNTPLTPLKGGMGGEANNRNGRGRSKGPSSGEAWKAVTDVAEKWGSKLWKRERPEEHWTERKRQMYDAESERLAADLAAMPPLAKTAAEQYGWRRLVEEKSTVTFPHFMKIFREVVRG